MSASLTFLHGNHIPRCIATVDKHFSYYTLQFMTRGGVELFYDDDRHELHGPHVWTCQPGPLIRFHEWPRGKPWEHRYIAFTGPATAEWITHGLWLTHPIQLTSPELVTRLRGWFDELLEARRHLDALSQRTAVNLLERILLELARHTIHTAAGSQPAWIEQVMSQLQSAHEADSDYHQMAEELGLGFSTFRRQFKRWTGKSLHDYRLDCRVAAAKELLGDTDLPIKRIAMRLGYQDVFYFSRQFHDRARVSPAAYRKSRQAINDT